MEFEALCHQVIDLSRKVAEYIQNERTSFQSVSVETKTINNFVTHVDKEAEERFVTGLRKMLPGAGFITEEGTTTEKGDVFNWIIDPLDGTTNFIHGIPCYCTSIALMRDKEIVLGVVLEVNRDECFYAWHEGPAYLNGTEIAVTGTSDLKDGLLATVFPYDDFGRENEYMELLKFLTNNSRGLRRLGSAAADLVYTAIGRFDGFYEYGLNSWDVAAGAFILERAGGTVGDFKGGRDHIFGEEILATNGHIHEELLKVVQRYFK